METRISGSSSVVTTSGATPGVGKLRWGTSSLPGKHLSFSMAIGSVALMWGNAVGKNAGPVDADGSPARLFRSGALFSPIANLTVVSSKALNSVELMRMSPGSICSVTFLQLSAFVIIDEICRNPKGLSSTRKHRQQTIRP